MTEPAKQPAIDPDKIAAIDGFLADGERDKGYRAFVMMRQIWPQLRELALAQESAWSCGARRSALPEPADCNWPVCGCDPHANKVVEALEESGVMPGHDETIANLNALTIRK